MFKRRSLLIFFLFILGILLLTGCFLTKTFMVTFDSQGGSAVESQTVKLGGLVTEPAVPTKTNYSFGGWYKESGCINVWDFDSDIVIDDLTLYARWVSSTYTVTFDKNDSAATGTMTVQTMASGATAKLIACAFTKTGWTFAGWATTPEGTVTYADEASYTIGTASVILYAKWAPPTTYSIRDIGPAGGLIFYDKGNYSGDPSWRYLEAAPSDQSTGTVWGCYETEITGADGTLVGTGKQNTMDILAECTTDDIAADQCRDCTLGGYNDWFLPSKDELYWIRANLKDAGVGNFESNYYWSSSEFDVSLAWDQSFGTGTYYLSSKNINLRVRAVRAF